MRHIAHDAPRLLAALALALTLSAPVSAQTAATSGDGEPITIVALGDSLMAGYELPSAAAFPVVLERALHERGYTAVTIVNAGVSGDTASGGLARLDWSVPPETDGVILELGANDMLRGLDPSVTEAALDEIVTRLQARGTPVLLAGMFAARNMGADYVETFDAIYPRLAETHDLVYYPFFLEGALGDQSLMLQDGIHPNASGVETMVQNMLPAVERFIERVREGRDAS